MGNTTRCSGKREGQPLYAKTRRGVIGPCDTRSESVPLSGVSVTGIGDRGREGGHGGVSDLQNRRYGGKSASVGASVLFALLSAPPDRGWEGPARTIEALDC